MTLLPPSMSSQEVRAIIVVAHKAVAGVVVRLLSLFCAMLAAVGKWERRETMAVQIYPPPPQVANRYFRLGDRLSYRSFIFVIDFVLIILLWVNMTLYRYLVKKSLDGYVPVQQRQGSTRGGPKLSNAKTKPNPNGRSSVSNSARNASRRVGPRRWVNINWCCCTLLCTLPISSLTWMKRKK